MVDYIKTMKETENAAYRKKYRIRVNSPGRKSLIVAFPYEVVEKEARQRNLSVEKFLSDYHAVACYNGFKGVNYTFEEIEGNGQRKA